MMMLRKFRESLVTLLTGVGPVERTLHNLSLIDFAMSASEAVKRSTSQAANFHVCLQLFVMVKQVDEDNNSTTLESSLVSPTSDINDVVNEIIGSEVLSGSDRELVALSFCAIREMVRKKSALIEIQTRFDSNSFSPDVLSPGSGYIRQLNAFWHTLMNSPAPEISMNASLTGTDSTADPNQWPYVGFQSLNPFRDFRATGPLGLTILEMWSIKYTHRAKEILKESHTGGTYYPLASVALNVLHWIIDHLLNGELDGFFLLNSDEPCDILCDIFSFTLLEFHRTWKISRPSSIMQFGEVRDKFRHQLTPLFRELVQCSDSILSCGNSRNLTPLGVLSGSDLQRELELWVRGEFESRSDSPKVVPNRLAIAKMTTKLH
eukprot:GHVH01005783.1.p1 GENE.GHVH01005783.1~~GHVH01005783.1.p1  ORF type:complete len:377 (-),score=58.45 GHVH01005783.1:1731-2861(-)